MPRRLRAGMYTRYTPTARQMLAAAMHPLHALLHRRGGTAAVMSQQPRPRYPTVTQAVAALGAASPFYFQGVEVLARCRDAVGRRGAVHAVSAVVAQHGLVGERWDAAGG